MSRPPAQPELSPCGTRSGTAWVTCSRSRLPPGGRSRASSRSHKRVATEAGHRVRRLLADGAARGVKLAGLGFCAGSAEGGQDGAHLGPGERDGLRARQAHCRAAHCRAAHCRAAAGGRGRGSPARPTRAGWRHCAGRRDGWPARCSARAPRRLAGRPTASLSRPSARVSLMPWTHLLIVLKVAGTTITASRAGRMSGSSGRLYRSRTGCPVSPATFPSSRNFMPSGVATTHTSHPCSWASRTNPGSWLAGGAPHAMMYSTGRVSAGTVGPSARQAPARTGCPRRRGRGAG